MWLAKLVQLLTTIYMLWVVEHLLTFTEGIRVTQLEVGHLIQHTTLHILQSRSRLSGTCKIAQTTAQLWGKTTKCAISLKILSVDHFGPTTPHREGVKGCRIVAHTNLLCTLQVAGESLTKAQISEVLACLLGLLEAHLWQRCIYPLSYSDEKRQTWWEEPQNLKVKHLISRGRVCTVATCAVFRHLVPHHAMW